MIPRDSYHVVEIVDIQDIPRDMPPKISVRAAAGYRGGILLVNCSGADAKITLKDRIASATELYTGKAVPVSDGGSLTLEPDAVIAAEYLRG